MPVVATSNATGETALVIVASKERLGTRAVMKASLASLGRQSTPESPGARTCDRLRVSLTGEQVCRTM